MMEKSSGVLFVRRVRWWAENRTAKARSAAVSLSEDELARAYRGIDGRAWPEDVPLTVPHDGGLAEVKHWKELVSLAEQHSNASVYDAVILATKPELGIQIPEVEFLGFDFGFYDDEYSVFSSIYHEAIHSSLLELREYASRLNDSLLLPTEAEVAAYRETRDSLRENGEDVEGADCYPIAVFGRRRC